MSTSPTPNPYGIPPLSDDGVLEMRALLNLMVGMLDGEEPASGLSADDLSFERFVAVYPTSATDRSALCREWWSGLRDADKAAAIQFVPGWLAQRRSRGRTLMPSMLFCLRTEPWKRITPPMACIPNHPMSSHSLATNTEKD